MIIKRCYIENFGTISQKTFDFQKGLNVIHAENGWGKTTLAVFLKVMFYGMEYSLARKTLSERTKYMSWHGGNYGGYLIFEMNGKEYKIIRFFGKKKAEDELELYDMASNCLSKDFTEPIGEAVFGIDAESFERSILISLDGKQPKMLDSINAKLNNLIDNADDISNFEKAYQYLEQTAKRIRPMRGNGSGKLAENAAKIAELDHELDICMEAESEVDAVTAELELLTQEQGALEEKLQTIREAIANAGDFPKKQEYLRLQALLAEKNEQKGKLAEKMNGRIPDPDEIRKYYSCAHRIEGLAEKSDQLSGIEGYQQDIEAVEEFFSGNIPEDSALESCSECMNEYEKLELKLAGVRLSEPEQRDFQILSDKYERQNISAEDADRCLGAYERYRDLLAEDEKVSAELSGQDYLNSPLGPANVMRDIFWSATGVIFIFIGVIFLSFYPLSGFGFMLLGLIVVTIGGVRVIAKSLKGQKQWKDSQNQNNESLQAIKEELKIAESEFRMQLQKLVGKEDIPESQIFKRVSDMKTELSYLAQLKKKQEAGKADLEKWTKRAEECKVEILRFFVPFQDLFAWKEGIGENGFAQEKHLLRQMKDKKSRWLIRKQQIEEHDRIKTELQQLEAEILPFLTAYSPSDTGSYAEQVEEIQEDARDFRELEKEIQDLTVKIKAAESEVAGTSELDAELKIPSFEKLQIDLDRYLAEMNHLAGEITSWQKKSDDLGMVADKRQDIESEREGLLSECNYLKNRYDILDRTMEYLEQAKNSLSTHYMKGMTEAFQKYWGMLVSDSRNLMQIDSELNAKIQEGGKSWDSEYLSRGYRDIVNVCTRMALIDTMYETEKPFIILDDPFVNLDDENLRKAMEFVGTVAQEYQVIYFICRESGASADVAANLME